MAIRVNYGVYFGALKTEAFPSQLIVLIYQIACHDPENHIQKFHEV